MISLINVKKDKTTEFVYIGRANYGLGLPQSKWGNPFHMKNESQRVSVLTSYLEYVVGNEELMASLHELDGQTLGCYCAPKKCHGNILIMLRELQIANKLDDLSSIREFIQPVN